MELILKRNRRGMGYTEGELYLLNKEKNRPELVCDTLEPEWRDLHHGDQKIMGRTAIPEGQYEVKLYPSPKFKRLMPMVCNVPNFSGILIHAGNTSADTEGCILVGERTEPDVMISSRSCFAQVYTLIEKALKSDQYVSLLVI